MRIICLFILSLLLGGCSGSGSDQEEVIMPSQPFTLRLGISSDEYLSLNQLDKRKNVNRQPAGLNFYKKRWSAKKQLGTVYFDHGKYSFTMPNVYSVRGLEDAEDLEKGIAAFNFNASSHADELELHDDARQWFLNFLSQLHGLGWQRVINFSDPRLSGEEAMRYYLREDVSLYNLPIDYDISLKQWMQLGYPRWMLYADGVFLEVGFKRDSERMDPEKYGAYLFTFQLQQAEDYAADHMEFKNRQRWQELWVDEIKRLKKIRYEKEAALSASGYTIDTSYTDPKIHPDDPVEP